MVQWVIVGILSVAYIMTVIAAWGYERQLDKDKKILRRFAYSRIEQQDDAICELTARLDRSNEQIEELLIQLKGVIDNYDSNTGNFKPVTVCECMQEHNIQVVRDTKVNEEDKDAERTEHRDTQVESTIDNTRQNYARESVNTKLLPVVREFSEWVCDVCYNHFYVAKCHLKKLNTQQRVEMCKCSSCNSTHTHRLVEIDTGNTNPWEDDIECSHLG